MEENHRNIIGKSSDIKNHIRDSLLERTPHNRFLL